MSAIHSVADLVQEINPYVGQDALLVYRVRTDKSMRVDENILGWALTWVLVADAGDAAALILKSTAAGSIDVSSPYATVALSAAEMAGLTAGTTYRMQLWRNSIGNVYPLTGLGLLVPQDGLPLV